MFSRKFFRTNYFSRWIAGGFAMIILIGAFLLNLPCASKNHLSIGLINALFTSTSATCVTGLVIADTFQQWTLFGQLVILFLMQIGGLGFITLGTYLLVFFRTRIGVRGRSYLKENLNALHISGVVRLTLNVINWTFLFESIGAFLLGFRFIPQFGFWKGIYFSIFHSVSAFCNAGFDLMGINSAYSSLSAYSGDWLVNLVITFLIIIGGLGFIVWADMEIHRFHFKKYMLHSKIVLVATVFLILSGTMVYYFLERNRLFSDMPIQQQLWSSFFSSVTARTAGFNTTDTALLSEPSKLFTILLMFIGGSPSSTAGGVKTVTIAILLITLYSNLKRTEGVNIFGRRLSNNAINMAAVVISINLILSVMGAILILFFQKTTMSDTLFETFSAMGTVGLSTGVTRNLCFGSKVVIILLMYCGRLGSLTFAFIFSRGKEKAPIMQPVEKVIVG